MATIVTHGPATGAKEIEGTAGVIMKHQQRPGVTIMGKIRINGKEYPYSPVCVAGITVGYRVGDYEVVILEGSRRCTCPDWMYRRQKTEKGCKHTAAVLALKDRKLI